MRDVSQKDNETARTKSSTSQGESASELISKKLAELGDWRGKALSRMRRLIQEADPGVVEEWKWMGTPVWSNGGIICTGESYKQVVKLTFAKGASLKDPARLFNSSLDGNARRAIDIHEGESVDEAAFKALVRQAIAFNRAARSKPSPSTRAKSGLPAVPKRKNVVERAERPTATTRKASPVSAKPALLAGGNPRIAKAEGGAPVQAYIAAMPGWKRDVGRRLDALIARNVPHVRKAVKWNSPFYGIEGQGWFLALHTFTNYVKVTFFHGTALRPPPPGGTAKDARWIDVHQDDLDEAQMTRWVKQAAALPGWVTSDIRQEHPEEGKP